jgi:DNA-binding beta-propeller fold protein YncE
MFHPAYRSNRSCKSRRFLLPAFCALLAVAAPYAVAQGPYRVLNHWTIGGQGGWDYLEADSANHHLFVTHNSSVEVLDSETGTKTGAITGLQSTHGVALDTAGKYGYISDGKGNAIVIFDRKTFDKIATVPAGGNPDGIAYEPVTHTVWAFNGHSDDVSVLDGESQKIVATIKLPGKPEFPVADGKGFIFDNIEDKNEIVKLDAHSLKLVATYPITGCESPSGLAIDLKKELLFSVCDGKVMAITSADSGKVVATATIGEGPDADRFDAAHNVAISSNGETGDMTFVDMSGAQPKVIQTLQTAPGARTMALDEKTGHIYTVTAEFGPRPAPSASNPRGRPTIVPGSFMVLEIGR